MTATFRKCGHPKDERNSIPTGPRRPDGSRAVTCRFCRHVRQMVVTAELRQERLNAGLPADGHTGAGAWL